MQLDVKEIGEVLRGVAPEVFSELEASEWERDVVLVEPRALQVWGR